MNYQQRFIMILGIVLCLWLGSAQANGVDSIRTSTLAKLKIAREVQQPFLNFVKAHEITYNVPAQLKNPSFFFIQEKTGFVVHSRPQQIPCPDNTGVYGIVYKQFKQDQVKELFSLCMSELEFEDEVFNHEYTLLQVLFRYFLLEQGYREIKAVEHKLPENIKLARHDRGVLLEIYNGKKLGKYSLSYLDEVYFEEVLKCMQEGELDIKKSVLMGGSVFVEISVPLFVYGWEGDMTCDARKIVVELRTENSQFIVYVDGIYTSPSEGK